MPLAILPSYIYLFAWMALAFLPYVFYSQNLYLVLLIYFFCSSLYYSVYAVAKYKIPLFFKTLFAFVFFLSIYGVYFAIVGTPIYWRDAAINVECNTFLLWFFASMMSVVPIYVFTCRGFIDEKIMKILFVIMIIASVYAFKCSYALQMKLAAMMGSTKEEFTITCVYSFLSILPLVVIFKKKFFLQLFLVCLMFVYFILSAKRGPIILGSICSLLIIWSMIHDSTPKKKILLLFLSLACMFGLYEFVLTQMETSEYFSLRIDQTLEGNTSRREEYSQIIWDYIINRAPTMDFFFGNGAHGTLLVNESFAHNDWLAIFLEQGLVGVLFYFFYWVGFVYSWVKSKGHFEAFVAIGLLVIIGFGKTMFSMYYMPISPEMIISSGFFSIVLGYYLAKAFPQHENSELPFILDEND